MDAKLVEAFGGLHHLLFGFGTAGACNAHGTRKGEEVPFPAGNNIKFVGHSYLKIFLIRFASWMSSRIFASS